MRSPARIAVATHPGAPDLTDDDRLACDLLAERGIEVEAIPWSQPGTDWSGYRVVLIRSTWDYHKNLEAFRGWAREVEKSGARLWNPAAVVAWNSEKTYLRDLEKAGIAIVPTAWVEQGGKAELAALLAESRWPAVVVKPTVSASAYRTWTQTREQAEARQQDFENLLADSGAMIQPLMPEVLEDGEWSFLFFRQAGRLAFSHAVLKKPAAGDFRVQSELGGKSEAQAPPPDLLKQVEALVEKASKVAPGELLYARIDGVVSQGAHAPAGDFLLMELELIEPFLFLGTDAGAGERFAAAIAAVLEEPPVPEIAVSSSWGGRPDMDQEQPEADTGSHRDVFISYKREDVAIARVLRQAFRAEGVTVWWDEELRTGDRWAERIDQVLSSVNVVVVLWSAGSVRSDWVRHEASIGRFQGNLAHARIDNTTQIPAPFQAIHMEDLSHWNEQEDDPKFRRLLQAVRGIRQHRIQAKRKRQRRYWASLLLLALLGAGIGAVLHRGMTQGNPAATLTGEPTIALPDGQNPKEALRQLNKVRPLNDREDGQPLSSLPNGVFGFDTPWTDPASSERTLESGPSGTAVLEIQKLSDGSVMLVGFVGKEDASKLRKPEGNIDAKLYPSAWEGAVTLVSIPVQAILKYEHSSSSRDVIDLKLSWPPEPPIATPIVRTPDPVPPGPKPLPPAEQIKGPLSGITIDIEYEVGVAELAVKAQRLLKTHGATVRLQPPDRLAEFTSWFQTALFYRDGFVEQAVQVKQELSVLNLPFELELLLADGIGEITFAEGRTVERRGVTLAKERNIQLNIGREWKPEPR